MAAAPNAAFAPETAAPAAAFVASDAEVLAIYNGGVTTDLSNESGLVSYYRFEGNANDLVGSNNGTIYGNPEWVEH